MLQLRRYVLRLLVISVKQPRHGPVELSQFLPVFIQIFRSFDERGVLDQSVGLIAEKCHGLSLLLHRVRRADGLLIVHEDIDRVVILLRCFQDFSYFVQFFFQYCVLHLFSSLLFSCLPHAG